jgi:hypothetical protein
MTDLVYRLNEVNGVQAVVIWPIINKIDDWPRTARMEPLRTSMIDIMNDFLFDL